MGAPGGGRACPPALGRAALAGWGSGARVGKHPRQRWSEGLKRKSAEKRPQEMGDRAQAPA